MEGVPHPKFDLPHISTLRPWDLLAEGHQTGTNAATFGYSYDPAGRLLSAVSTRNDAEHPATLFQAQSYNAVGLTSAYYGLPQGSSTPAYSQTLSYDTRTRLITEADSTPTQPNLYNYAVTYDGDSNVVNLTDSLLGTWTYTPDNLDRLSTATATAGTYNGLTLTETYDAFGNRENQVPSGSYQGPVPSALLVTFNNGKNRVDQWAYDAADRGGQSHESVLAQLAFEVMRIPQQPRRDALISFPAVTVK